MELEAARGVHFGTSSSARTLEDPGLGSMVKRTFSRIGINEVNKLISTNSFSIFQSAKKMNSLVTTDWPLNFRILLSS